MQLLHEAQNPSWNTSCHLILSRSVPLPGGSKSSFPYRFGLSMTCSFALFLPKTKRTAACEMRLFQIKCGVLQEEGISAINSCPLKDHSPPQSATENPSLCTGSCHLPSALPHYTKMYALAAGGLFPCRELMLSSLQVTLHSSSDTVLQGLLNTETDSCSRHMQGRKTETFLLSSHNFSQAPYRSFALSRCLHPSLLHKAHTHVFRCFAEL